MKRIVFVGVLVLASSAYGQKQAAGQIRSGEAGYKIGCSAAAAANIPSCGELPSGRKFTKDEEKKSDTKKDQKPNTSSKSGNAQQ